MSANKKYFIEYLFHKISRFLLLFVVLLFITGCTTREIYVGSDGNFYDVKKFPVDSKELLDMNKKHKRNIVYGMRESAAIQRATMRPYQIGGKWYYPTKVKIGDEFNGIASWYGPNFHAKKTSNGEKYNMFAHTAASKVLPMNSIVKVYNKENHKTTIVRINDRGPFVDGRIIDLSNSAAHDIDMVGKGTAKVKIVVIGFGGMIANNAMKDVPTELSDKESFKKEFKVSKDAPIAVEGGKFLLQVGAFKNKEGATLLKQKYNTKEHYKVVIKASEINNDTIYRVFVTGFNSENEAEDFAKSHKIKAIIIRQ